jgi:AcrR family transcriptional regulator
MPDDANIAARPFSVTHPRLRLDPKLIVSRATEMLELRGHEGLTMRGLARDLGVSPLATYPHVGPEECLWP